MRPVRGRLEGKLLAWGYNFDRALLEPTLEQMSMALSSRRPWSNRTLAANRSRPDWLDESRASGRKGVSRVSCIRSRSTYLVRMSQTSSQRRVPTGSRQRPKPRSPGSATQRFRRSSMDSMLYSLLYRPMLHAILIARRPGTKPASTEPAALSILMQDLLRARDEDTMRLPYLLTSPRPELGEI